MDYICLPILTNLLAAHIDKQTQQRQHRRLLFASKITTVDNAIDKRIQDKNPNSKHSPSKLVVDDRTRRRKRSVSRALMHCPYAGLRATANEKGIMEARRHLT
jgi:hypothetical protein